MYSPDDSIPSCFALVETNRLPVGDSLTVSSSVSFSAISSRFLCFARLSAMKPNQRIAKLPVRRPTIPAKKARYMALTRAAFLRNFRLCKPEVDEVLNDCSPVHGAIITYVIDKSKHHRDWFNGENHDMDSLAKRLTTKREVLGLSQSELAKKAKLKNQSIIGMLESGARKSSSHIPAIAHALGVESLWLSSGIGPETRGSAKTYELSESAMKIALLVNEMSEEKQISLLHFLTAEQARLESK